MKKRRSITAQDLFMDNTEQVFDYETDPPTLIGYVTTVNDGFFSQSRMSGKSATWNTKRQALSFLELQNKKRLIQKAVDKSQQSLF
jgi:hypothetical protein